MPGDKATVHCSWSRTGNYINRMRERRGLTKSWSGGPDLLHHGESGPQDYNYTFIAQTRDTDS